MGQLEIDVLSHSACIDALGAVLAALDYHGLSLAALRVHEAMLELKDLSMEAKSGPASAGLFPGEDLAPGQRSYAEVR